MSDEKNINIVVSESLHKRAKTKAAEMGVTLQALYADALERRLDPSDPANELTIAELKALAGFMRHPIDEFDLSLRNHLLLVLKQRYS